ncbi:hypothetical protein DICVIV_01743, partial [Dictyocaulus viviparus]
MHNVKSGDQSFIVIMVDPPPCGCVRLANGKKKRCKKHKRERRLRRKAKKGKKMVKDDDSDRKKVVELRHAGESFSDEDKAIEGAYTPDKICVVGPAGVAVLMNVDKPAGGDAGPPAKLDKSIAGILVKGPHDIPQFIPEDKIEKDEKGEPKYQHYTRGRLVKGPHGEAIFYADGQCAHDNMGKPKNVTAAGVDKSLQGKIGETVFPPCEVEINESGMPEIRQITNANDVPKDKHATVGVLTKNNDGVVVFTQTGGVAVGGKDNIGITPNSKTAPCEVIGKVVSNKDGANYVVAVNQKTKPDEKVIGKVVQGNFREPVFVREIKSSGPAAATIGAVH